MNRLDSTFSGTANPVQPVQDPDIAEQQDQATILQLTPGRFFDERDSKKATR